MTRAELQTLIQTGEGQLLEFKESGTSHLGREICSFANSLGGRILLGVSDDGMIRAVQNGNRLRSEVQSIARNLDPPLMVSVEEVGGVLVVDIPSSRFKPHSSAGKFYLREGATCQQMGRDEIREFFYQEGLVYFDEKENERFSWPNDLDQDAYDQMVRVCGITPSLDQEQLLKNLGLLKNNFMTYAGSLLFGKSVSRLVPGASVNCCLFQGTTKTRILDQKIYAGDFLSNYHHAVSYLVAHLNTAYEIGFERKERLELPEGALREALLNAMGHRDYRTPGDLQVHIFQDRVEIINPGGLVGGLTLETLGCQSIPRNPLLFGMMHRMNLVEKVGSGLKRIKEMCQEYPCEHEIVAESNWYSMIFWRSVSTLSKAPLRAQSGAQSGAQSKEVLLKLESKDFSANELVVRLGLESKTGAFKRTLQELLRQGFVEYTIPSKPTSRLQKYRLTDKGRQFLAGLGQ